MANAKTPIPAPITYEIFINQRYNSKLNSDRFLALPIDFFTSKKPI